MKYSVILEPQEEGGFTARCLELPGAISQGETKTEALENIKEAISLILEVFREDLESLNRTKWRGSQGRTCRCLLSCRSSLVRS